MSRRPIVALVVAMLVAGCDLALGERSFSVSYPVDAGAATTGVDVVLTDRTGSVTMLDLPELGPNAPVFDPGLTQLPNTPTAIVLTWTGSLCDIRITMTYEERQGAPLLAVATQRAPGQCVAMAVGRSVIIRFSRPVDAASVTLQGP